MGLENAQWISELVDTNPVTATDPVSEGSNHLRMIKDVLQNTFPGYDGANGAVELTPDELNALSDAALKGGDNDFTGTNTFSARQFSNAGIRYAKDQDVQFVDQADAVVSLIKFELNDDFRLGSTAYRTAFRGADGSSFQTSGGETNTEFTNRAAGSLLVADSAGALSPVARTGGNEQTFTNENRFDLATNYNGNVQLANGVALMGRTVGLALRNLANVTNGDQSSFGDPLLTSNFYYLDTARFVIGTDETFRGTNRAAGSLEIMDMGGSRKKVGFRNPTASGETVSRLLQQSDEGKIIVTNGGGDNPVIFTANVLEDFTTIRLLANQASRIVPGTIATFRFYDGGGAFVDVGVNGIEVAPGSVIELWYQGTNALVVFGNGITAL